MVEPQHVSSPPRVLPQGALGPMASKCLIIKVVREVRAKSYIFIRRKNNNIYLGVGNAFLALSVGVGGVTVATLNPFEPLNLCHTATLPN